MRFWFRSLAVGALVGLGIGFVVGGTLGRIFMRVLFFTRQDTRGIETAMGAIIGELTSGGTVFICIFGAIMGVGLGLAYVGLRALLPSTARWRAPLFVCAASGLMLGFLVRINREDFALLPVTLSLLLIAGSVALTAAPVPVLVDRFAPDREHTRGNAARAAVGAGMLAIAVYAVTGIAAAYGS